MLALVRLQPQRHKRVAGGHPWIYSNELVMDGAAKSLPPGALVRFAAHDGAALGVGFFNPRTLIAGRILSRAPLGEVDQTFVERRIERARLLRDSLVAAPYYRLIHAEADGLPGLIVDRFGDALSVQLNCAGMDALWPVIEAALERVLAPRAIVLHNESPARALEGLGQEVHVHRGAFDGPVPVIENGLTYYADLVGGQKTGWYFDQRDAHALMARYAPGKSVLDLYTHAGGFALLAAQAGASRVVGVDSSAPALALAAQACARAGLGGRCGFDKADVFEDLERRLAAKEKWDIVIADPPPFVRSKKDVSSGARGYRKLAKLCAGALAPGGLLYIASCSHNMPLDLFVAEVARGLHEARREGRILHTVFAAPDHPVHPHLPESAYLKGVVVAVE